MKNKHLKIFLRKEDRNYLINARKKAGLSALVASRRLGHASPKNLRIYEKNGNIPSSELIKASEIYKIPFDEVSKFLMELQIEAFRIKSQSPT